MKATGLDRTDLAHVHLLVQRPPSDEGQPGNQPSRCIPALAHNMPTIQGHSSVARPRSSAADADEHLGPDPRADWPQDGLSAVRGIHVVGNRFAALVPTLTAAKIGPLPAAVWNATLRNSCTVAKGRRCAPTSDRRSLRGRFEPTRIV
jgi:hypothetical protein